MGNFPNKLIMKTFTLPASCDDLILSIAVFEPSCTPKGIFQIVHGMAEHKERYYPFMEALAAGGYVAVIGDIRGHGASVKGPDDLGFLYDGGWKGMVEDVRVIMDWAVGEYGGLPVTLFGHSMGSMIVRSFAKRYDSRIARLIVCGSPSDNPAKGAGLALAWLISVLLGPRHRSGLLNAMSFGAYNKPFCSEGDFAWLSRRRANAEDYIADPLCGFCFTANGFRGLLGLMSDCYGAGGWAVANPSLPVHFISGGDDPCRISDKAFAAAADFMRERGYRNVTSRLYDGLRHEILLESEGPDVVKDILDLC